MQVVHTLVKAEGNVKVEMIEVPNLTRATLLSAVGEVDCKMTEYKRTVCDGLEVGSRPFVAILRCPQEKAWTYDTHTFTCLPQKADIAAMWERNGHCF